MHEYSVVRSLLGQVATTVEPRHASRVSKIQLAVGEFAGIDAQLLELAFKQLAPQTFSEEVRLVVRSIPLQARCSKCDQTFPVESFRFVCPHCGDTGVKIVSGQELILESVTIEESL
jgi:hydrogenase nickel incorporation protein HypA/HybF